MKTFALILSTVSVAFATFLPGNPSYISTQLARPTLPPTMTIRSPRQQILVNPIAIRQGQALWENRRSPFINSASLGSQRVETVLGPRIRRNQIFNPSSQTNTFTAEAFPRFERMLARPYPPIIASTGSFVPSTQAFMGTIRSSINGGFSVTPLSSSMNAGSSAVVVPSVGTSVASSFVRGRNVMSGLNRMSMNGVQQRTVNPYTIINGGSF